MFLAERFHRLLDAEDDLGLIVVDSRFREDDQGLRRFFGDLTKGGTPYMQLPRIVEGLVLGPSNHSIGLQCADLVVAMTANPERGPGELRSGGPLACRPDLGDLRARALMRGCAVPGSLRNQASPAYSASRP